MREFDYWVLVVRHCPGAVHHHPLQRGLKFRHEDLNNACRARRQSNLLVLTINITEFLSTTAYIILLESSEHLAYM